MLVISQVVQHAAIGRLPAGTVYSDPLIVFPLEDLAAFGLLQWRVHETWGRFLGSSMKDDLPTRRRTASLPFPSPMARRRTADRMHRSTILRVSLASDAPRDEGLTDRYRRFHDPDDETRILRLRELHAAFGSCRLGRLRLDGRLSDLRVPFGLRGRRRRVGSQEEAVAIPLARFVSRGGARSTAGTERRARGNRRGAIERAGRPDVVPESVGEDPSSWPSSPSLAPTSWEVRERPGRGAQFSLGPRWPVGWPPHSKPKRGCPSGSARPTGSDRRLPHSFRDARLRGVGRRRGRGASMRSPAGGGSSQRSPPMSGRATPRSPTSHRHPGDQLPRRAERGHFGPR